MLGRKERKLKKDLANVWYQTINASIDAGIQHRKYALKKFRNHGVTLWKLKRGLGNLYKTFKAHDARLNMSDYRCDCLQGAIHTLESENAVLRKRIDALSGD